MIESEFKMPYSESYHEETDSLSCTQFKLFVHSPLEYYHTFITKKLAKKEATRFTEVGKVVHAITLEKKSLDDLVRVYPSSCMNKKDGLIGSAAAEFREKIFPVVAMKEDQIEQIEKVVAAVYSSDLGPIVNSGAKFEERLDAIVEGVACRCKIDIHSVFEDMVRIWDVKTTERIAPADWNRTAKQFGYPIQDAFYSLIAETHYGLPSVFRFWAVETVKLYRVETRWFDERSREIAKDFVRKKLKEFAARKESGNWNDGWEPTMVVGPWDFNEGNDDEVVEFEG